VRLFQDAAAVAKGLRLECRSIPAPLLESFQFRHIDNRQSRKGCGCPWSPPGRHPIGALMAMHGLQQEKRKMRSGFGGNGAVGDALGFNENNHRCSNVYSQRLRMASADLGFDRDPRNRCGSSRSSSQPIS